MFFAANLLEVALNDASNVNLKMKHDEGVCSSGRQFD